MWSHLCTPGLGNSAFITFYIPSPSVSQPNPQMLAVSVWRTGSALYKQEVNNSFSSNCLSQLQSSPLSHSHSSWNDPAFLAHGCNTWVTERAIWLRWSWLCSSPPYLEAVGMDDLVADGALHKHEVELVLLFVQCVLLARLFTYHTHRCVGQNRLQGLNTHM